MPAFDEVLTAIKHAMAEVEADGGASPVLVAVVREFQAKADKATASRQPDAIVPHDAIIELEQAGDSAKAAAEADAGVATDVREAVLAAHLAICKLKAAGT
jgi:hypothetical protein